MTGLLVLLAFWQEAAPPTEKDGEEAVKKLKQAFAQHGEQGKIAAVREAAKVRHDKVIRAIGEVLKTDAPTVRIAAALALGDIDHPASAEVLVQGATANQKQRPVLAAVARTLGTLGWQSGAEALHDLLRKAGDADLRELFPEILSSLGKIGSVASVDPILDFLRKLDARGKDPWPGEGAMRQSANGALAAITGGSENGARAWETWWKANKQVRMTQAKSTYWLKKTHARQTVGPGERAPADSILVVTRVAEPPAPRGQ